MKKLYFTPGACSLAPHIAFREANLPFERVKVDFMRGKTTEDGGHLTDVSPNGYVPALVLDDGKILTEVGAILFFLADSAPEAKLAPPRGSYDFVRFQQWIVFIATELHKGLGPLFSPKATEELKAASMEKLSARLGYVVSELGDKRWLLGDQFTVADAYLFYFLRTWQRFLEQDLPPGLRDYYARLAERPAVQAALEAEFGSPRA